MVLGVKNEKPKEEQEDQAVDFTIEQLVTRMRQLEREYDVVSNLLEAKLQVLGINLNLSPTQEAVQGTKTEELPAKDPTQWTEWDGSQYMPFPAGTLVDVTYRDGSQTLGVTAGLIGADPNFKKVAGNRVATHWKRDKSKSSASDIVAYRLHVKLKTK